MVEITGADFVLQEQCVTSTVFGLRSADTITPHFTDAQPLVCPSHGNNGSLDVALLQQMATEC